MEGAHFIKTGELLDLSEQQFVDCARRADGCVDGNPFWAFFYAKFYAQVLEIDYPYKAASVKNCLVDKRKGIVKVQ